MAEKGKFIVFEGIDGSGKSTQVKRLHSLLQTENQDVILTFEPSQGPVGSLVRQMLEGRVEIDQRTIAALFAADRTDHLLNRENGIKALVDQGRIVLCDRYYFSSYAYHAMYMDMDWVIGLNAQNAEILRPDLNIFIDVDPDICLERIKSGRKSFDMYEKIGIMKQVRKNYFTAFEKLKTRETIAVIDGNASPDRVEQKIQRRVRDLLSG
ncbi:dTMP kinase [Desulfospira joergensenii]|uniref:dTMP kinase n=1 Tax=Desulfospira joergensenii TaxID=53329 RepID=UPI0003B39524|nr:dTMP kinase [Desulfospira joergensenii]